MHGGLLVPPDGLPQGLGGAAGGVRASLVPGLCLQLRVELPGLQQQAADPEDTELSHVVERDGAGQRDGRDRLQG